MEALTRRTVLASATGAAAVGLAGQLLGQEAEKGRGAGSRGKDCLCMIQIPNLGLGDREAPVEGQAGQGAGQSRELVSALVGALVPIIADEIIKATRARDPVAATARGVHLQDLSAGRDGERGVDEQALRGLFSGSIAAPGIKIGVVVGGS